MSRPPPAGPAAASQPNAATTRPVPTIPINASSSCPSSAASCDGSTRRVVCACLPSALPADRCAPCPAFSAQIAHHPPPSTTLQKLSSAARHPFLAQVPYSLHNPMCIAISRLQSRCCAHPVFDETRYPVSHTIPKPAAHCYTPSAIAAHRRSSPLRPLSSCDRPRCNPLPATTPLRPAATLPLTLSPRPSSSLDPPPIRSPCRYDRTCCFMPNPPTLRAASSSSVVHDARSPSAATILDAVSPFLFEAPLGHHVRVRLRPTFAYNPISSFRMPCPRIWVKSTPRGSRHRLFLAPLINACVLYPLLLQHASAAARKTTHPCRTRRPSRLG
ncbi:hypothetical protein FB451DRAFT_1569331 [Mycena latifolia]|nr:hypothetical protein FB451DRAFT_1569331 [Mycena latifolia]